MLVNNINFSLAGKWSLKLLFCKDRGVKSRSWTNVPLILDEWKKKDKTNIIAVAYRRLKQQKLVPYASERTAWNWYISTHPLPHSKAGCEHNREKLISAHFYSPRLENILFITTVTREKFFLLVAWRTMKYHDRIINDLWGARESGSRRSGRYKQCATMKQESHSIKVCHFPACLVLMKMWKR